MALYQLCCVDNNITFLQMVAQWMSQVAYRESKTAALRTFHQKGWSILLDTLWKERRNLQHNSRSDSGFRVCFHDLIWSKTGFLMKRQRSLLPSNASCFCCINIVKMKSVRSVVLLWLKTNTTAINSPQEYLFTDSHFRTAQLLMPTQDLDWQ